MALSMAKLFTLFQLTLLFATCRSDTFSPAKLPLVPKPPYYKPMPPTQSPVMPPCPPPSKPPTQPPVKPPSPPPSKPPTQPPVKPPSPPPSKPPTQPPVSPPTQPPVSPPVSGPRPGYVQGMVYCKSCKHLGVDTLSNAKPLAGARVSLKCYNKKHFAKRIATTNKGGYFFMTATAILKHFGYPNCRVFLSTAPRKSRCRSHTDINNGTTGAVLHPLMTFAPVSYDMYTVGPFAFEPSKKFCKKHPKPSAHITGPPSLIN